MSRPDFQERGRPYDIPGGEAFRSGPDGLQPSIIEVVPSASSGDSLRNDTVVPADQKPTLGGPTDQKVLYTRDVHMGDAPTDAVVDKEGETAVVPELLPHEKEIIVIGAPHGAGDVGKTAYQDEVISAAVADVDAHHPGKQVAVSMENAYGIDGFSEKVQRFMDDEDNPMPLSRAIRAAVLVDMLSGNTPSVKVSDDTAKKDDEVYQDAHHGMIDQVVSGAKGKILVHFESHDAETAEKMRDPAIDEAVKFIEGEAETTPYDQWDQAYYDKFRGAVQVIAGQRDVRDQSDRGAIQKLAANADIAKVIVIRGPEHRITGLLQAGGYSKTRLVHSGDYESPPFALLVDQASDHPEIPITNRQIELVQLADGLRDRLPPDATEAEVYRYQNQWIANFLAEEAEINRLKEMGALQ